MFYFSFNFYCFTFSLIIVNRCQETKLGDGEIIVILNIINDGVKTLLLK